MASRAGGGAGNTSSSARKPLAEDDGKTDEVCPVCVVDVVDNDAALLCQRCNVWSHCECIGIDDDEYSRLMNSDDDWFCIACTAIMANNISWGEMKGEDDIEVVIKSIYKEITTWNKNMFMLPRGKHGTGFISELTRLLSLFTDNTKWKRLSLTLVHIFIPLMLQKPSPNSKAKENTKYLGTRLQRWKDGKLDSIIGEVREIQKRVKRSDSQISESRSKAFCRLMFVGKVGQALKFLDNNSDIKGVHKLNRQVKGVLAEKHPCGEKAPHDVKLVVTAPEAEVVIFEQINAEVVQLTAKYVNGSGGPTLVDADMWRHLLCSKSYGKTTNHLCGVIAEFAKVLATEEVPGEILTEFVACRLVPLDKGSDSKGDIGVRPVGVGEVLRRIVGKLVVDVVKSDIQDAVGPLQTCAGLRSGIEGSIHAVKEIWDEDDTEAALLVDADNAFNRLNRKLALHNIRELCPVFHRYLYNTYQLPATLVIKDTESTQYLLSSEGCTQGDVAAMGFYALGIQPLTAHLSTVIEPRSCSQCWYADDSSAVGKLGQIRVWWDELCTIGPKYGYYPKSSKTVLIIKDAKMFSQAKKIFNGSGIKLTVEGERHLGAAIGSSSFRESYVTDKVFKWTKDVEELAEIAKEEPQAALSAFTKGLSHRWTFVQRTIANISHLFEPLEMAIRDMLIPALTGKQVSDIERELFSLPVRYGGLGLINPVESANREFDASFRLTKTIAELIKQQELTLKNYDTALFEAILSEVKEQKEKLLVDKLHSIRSKVENENLARAITLAQEKGAGAWLTVLPLQSLGYTLNKQEFRDSIRLRYGWPIPEIPIYCVCPERKVMLITP